MMANRFLVGFLAAGLVLVTASWLITGERSVATGAVPLALLLMLGFGRKAMDGKGQSGAR